MTLGQDKLVRQYAIAVPVLLLAGLFAYKWRSSFAVLQATWLSGSFAARSDIVSFDGARSFSVAESTLNYFGVIWPALAFGILIGAAVRAFVPTEWLVRLSTGGFRERVAAGAAGAPLMLCSCCVAPVFSTVYERSNRLGPSLALMLASPSLNPAALILTSFMFAPSIAVARLVMALLAVLAGGVVIEKIVTCETVRQLPRQSNYATGVKGLKEAAAAFSRSLAEVALRTLPALVVGVLCSMLLLQVVPKEWLTSQGFQSMAVVATATLAVPLALPTFFEIPLALGLIAAGAPAGAAVALLFAGPAINLSSLFALAKATNWKVAATLGIFIWALAVAGGLLV